MSCKLHIRFEQPTGLFPSTLSCGCRTPAVVEPFSRMFPPWNYPLGRGSGRSEHGMQTRRYLGVKIMPENPALPNHIVEKTSTNESGSAESGSVEGRLDLLLSDLAAFTAEAAPQILSGDIALVDFLIARIVAAEAAWRTALAGAVSILPEEIRTPLLPVPTTGWPSPAAAHAAASAAARHAQLERARSTLAEVLRLSHSKDTSFSPLQEVQQKAAILQAALGTKADPVAALTPFVALLQLVHEGQALDEEEADRLSGAVAATFGRLLASAALRGNLLLDGAPRWSPPATMVAHTKELVASDTAIDATWARGRAGSPQDRLEASGSEDRPLASEIAAAAAEPETTVEVAAVEVAAAPAPEPDPAHSLDLDPAESHVTAPATPPFAAAEVEVEVPPTATASPPTDPVPEAVPASGPATETGEEQAASSDVGSPVDAEPAATAVPPAVTAGLQSPEGAIPPSYLADAAWAAAADGRLGLAYHLARVAEPAGDDPKDKLLAALIVLLAATPLCDGNGFLDDEIKQRCAEVWHLGRSSNGVDSCRLVALAAALRVALLAPASGADAMLFAYAEGVPESRALSAILGEAAALARGAACN